MAIGVDGFIENPAFVSTLAAIRKELHDIARDDYHVLTAERVDKIFSSIKKCAEESARSNRIHKDQLRNDVHHTQAYLRDIVLGLAALDRLEAPGRIAIKTALCLIEV